MRPISQFGLVGFQKWDPYRRFGSRIHYDSALESTTEATYDKIHNTASQNRNHERQAKSVMEVVENESFSRGFAGVIFPRPFRPDFCTPWFLSHLAPAFGRPIFNQEEILQ